MVAEDPGESVYGRGASPLVEIPAFGRGASPLVEIPAFGRGASPLVEIPAIGRGASPFVEIPAWGRGASPFVEMPAAYEIAMLAITASTIVSTSALMRFAERREEDRDILSSYS